MKGKALVDLPLYGLKCGEVGEVPDKEAKQLEADGSFDPRAVEQEQPKRRKKQGEQD